MSHELWLLLIGIGECRPRRIGILGELHPAVVAVAKNPIEPNSKLCSHKFSDFHIQNDYLTNK